MTKIKRKYIAFGFTGTEVNDQALPSTHTALNYTPIQVSSEGNDKVSAHLKGIDNAIKKPVYNNVTTSNTITTLDTTSSDIFVLSGTTAGTRYNLGNATTYSIGKTYNFINNSSTLIQIQNNSNTFLDFVYLGEQVEFILLDNSSANGIWRINKLQSNNVVIFEDFLGATTAYDLNWGVTTASGGTNTLVASEVNHIGIHQINNTTTNGSLARIHHNNLIRNNSTQVFEGLIRVNTALSNNRIIFGLTTGTTVEATPVASAYFYIDSTLTQWQGRTSNASTSTNTNTGVTFTVSSWNRFTIVLNSTRVDFYINGSLVASNTTNIPVNTAALYPTFAGIKTSGGGIAITANIDYYKHNFNLTR